MKTVTAFMTSNGLLFETELQAKTYEIMMEKQGIIDSYLSSKANAYTSGPQRTIARQSVISWEAWKAENEIIFK